MGTYGDSIARGKDVVVSILEQFLPRAERTAARTGNSADPVFKTGAIAVLPALPTGPI